MTLSVSSSSKRPSSNPPPASAQLTPWQISARRVGAMMEKHLAGRKNDMPQPTELGRLLSRSAAQPHPLTSITDYLLYLEKLNLDPACCTCACMYALRLKRQKKVVITPSNVQQLMLVSVGCAMKMLDDAPLADVNVAVVGGVTWTEYKMLEERFAKLLEYEFFIEPKDFQDFEQRLIKSSQGARLCTIL